MKTLSINMALILLSEHYDELTASGDHELAEDVYYDIKQLKQCKKILTNIAKKHGDAILIEEMENVKLIDV